MTNNQQTILIRNVAVLGQPGLDVRAGPELILEVGPSLPRRNGDEVVDGAGGEVIPGLHDHHVHLRAVVAARQSVDVSAAASPADFDAIVFGLCREGRRADLAADNRLERARVRPAGSPSA